MKAQEYLSKVLIATAALTVLRMIPGLFIGQPLSTELVAWSVLSNFLVSAFFIYCILRSPWSGMKLLTTVFLVNFVIADFNVLIEAIFFSIEIARVKAIEMLTGGFIVTLLFALIVVVLVNRMWRPTGDVTEPPGRRRWHQWLWRIVVCVIVYVILYFTAGAMIFPYVREFYECKALPDLSQILLMQVFRGLLYVCAAIPLVRMFNVRRFEAAFLTGLAFSILGGVAPLIIPNPYMPANIRLVHGFEVGISNFLFGVIAGLLLFGIRPRRIDPTEQEGAGERKNVVRPRKEERGMHLRVASSWVSTILTSLVILCLQPELASQDQHFQKLHFSTWGSTPPKIGALLSDQTAQKILFATRRGARSIGQIAVTIGEADTLVEARIKELAQVDLVKGKDKGWVSNIGLFDENDMREVERLGLAYAARQAEILKAEIPGLKRLYGRTTLSRSFPWDEVSLIIVGAFLSDFCVVDRIPYRSDNLVFAREVDPTLAFEGGGKEWFGVGYVISGKTFPAQKWNFYQNSYSLYKGGLSRFGYFRGIDEKRKGPPRGPENFAGAAEGRILFALADGDLDFQQLETQTHLNKERLARTLDELMAFDLPAVIVREGKYRTTIPILTASDFNLLLPELDRIGERIFREIRIAHAKERWERAKKNGSGFIIPSNIIDIFVRDKAIQILVESRTLTPVPSPPVSWNFGVWGWKGFLPMREQILRNVQPDLFLKTAISSAEMKVIEESNAMKSRILGGERLLDLSSPTRAYLTRLSGWYHSDSNCLKSVEVPWNETAQSTFERPESRRRAEYLAMLDIVRMRLPEGDPKDGDVVPIFTSEEDTHVYFYYRGGWRFLYRTAYTWLWNQDVEEYLREGMSELEQK